MFYQLFFEKTFPGSWFVKLLLVGVMAVVLVAVGCATETALPEKTPVNEGQEVLETTGTIELKLAHFWPSSHEVETHLVPGWAKAIEDATDGRVKLISYPGETLLKAAEIYNGIETGITDIGIGCYVYTPGRFPVMEVFELSGFTSLGPKFWGQVIFESVKKLNPAELQDTKNLMNFSSGPGLLLTKTPVKKLSDLKGMEIRSTGLTNEALKLLGATPIGMPMAEAYESLSKGVIKGALAPMEAIKGWKFAEVIDYATNAPFIYNSLFFVIMNQKKFDSLPTDIRQAFEDATAKYYEETVMGFYEYYSDESKKYAEEEGVEFLSLSDDEKELWLNLLKPIHDNYAVRMKEQGLPGDEILRTVKEVSEQLAEQYQK